MLLNENPYGVYFVIVLVILLNENPYGVYFVIVLVILPLPAERGL